MKMQKTILVSLLVASTLLGQGLVTDYTIPHNHDTTPLSPRNTDLFLHPDESLKSGNFVVNPNLTGGFKFELNDSFVNNLNPFETPRPLNINFTIFESVENGQRKTVWFTNDEYGTNRSLWQSGVVMDWNDSSKIKERTYSNLDSFVLEFDFVTADNYTAKLTLAAEQIIQSSQFAGWVFDAQEGLDYQLPSGDSLFYSYSVGYIYSAVPEPSTYILLVGVLALFVAICKKRLTI